MVAGNKYLSVDSSSPLYGNIHQRSTQMDTEGYLNVDGSGGLNSHARIGRNISVTDSIQSQSILRNKGNRSTVVKTVADRGGSVPAPNF